MDQPQPEYLDDVTEFGGPDELLRGRTLTDTAVERNAITEELLEIGRELADLPVDGDFGRKVDLRERQKELRQRLAELDDVVVEQDEEFVVDPDEEYGRADGRELEEEWNEEEQDEEWIDLERDGYATQTQLPPPDRFRV